MSNLVPYQVSPHLWGFILNKAPCQLKLTSVSIVQGRNPHQLRVLPLRPAPEGCKVKVPFTPPGGKEIEVTGDPRPVMDILGLCRSAKLAMEQSIHMGVTNGENGFLVVGAKPVLAESIAEVCMEDIKTEKMALMTIIVDTVLDDKRTNFKVGLERPCIETLVAVCKEMKIEVELEVIPIVRFLEGGKFVLQLLATTITVPRLEGIALSSASTSTSSS